MSNINGVKQRAGVFEEVSIARPMLGAGIVSRRFFVPGDYVFSRGFNKLTPEERRRAKEPFSKRMQTPMSLGFDANQIEPTIPMLELDNQSVEQGIQIFKFCTTRYESVDRLFECRVKSALGDSLQDRPDNAPRSEMGAVSWISREEGKKWIRTIHMSNVRRGANAKCAKSLAPQSESLYPPE
jgi:hypothetical protein